MNANGYTDEERQALLRSVATGATAPTCPRCHGACAVIRTGPSPDVSYVRDRVVVRCSGCRRSAGAEAEELTP